MHAMATVALGAVAVVSPGFVSPGFVSPGFVSSGIVSPGRSDRCKDRQEQEQVEETHLDSRDGVSPTLFVDETVDAFLQVAMLLL